MKTLPYEDFVVVELDESTDKPVLLTLRNIPVAVVVPYQWWRQLTEDKP